MSQKMDELNAEIEEMEKGIFNSQTDPVEEPTEDPDVSIATLEAEDEVVVEPVEAEEAGLTTSKPKRVSWKKRFNGVNQMHAAYKHKTTAQLADMQNQINALMDENRRVNALVDSLQAQKDTFTESFTQEDIEVLGEETVNSLKKATNNVVEPLKQQLEQERKLRVEQQARNIEMQKGQAQQAFLDRLGNIVPDYLEVDSNPQFINWMREVDPASGYTREDLFKHAEQTGDVGRVANFMLDFKSMVNPLESKITPTTASRSVTTTSQAQAEKPMTWEEIDKHYDDVSKGKFRGREKLRQEIEARIDRQAFS